MDAEATTGPGAGPAPDRTGARAHIRDVARLAGVSHQTVSRVLNDQATVRPATRDRVLAAISQLDYRPSHAARALNTGRTRALGVITNDDRRFGPVSVLHGIGEAAWEQGYLVSTVALRSLRREAVQDAVGRLLDQSVDAIIVIASQDTVARALAEVPRPVPTVMLDRSVDERIPVVCVDERAGARMAVRHLRERGHRTVWHVAGPPQWIAAQERLAGWRAELRATGAPLPDPLFGDWTADSGYALGRLLAARGDVTAVFAGNDQMALGVLHALHDAGRRVPGDVSVIGFDDIQEAAHLTPPLSTVRVDFTEVGRRCLAVALDQLEHPGRRERQVVTPELVVRDSTG